MSPAGEIFIADAYNYRVETVTYPSGTAPVITSGAPAAATAGATYAAPLTATGTAVLTWSVTTGTLPTGLSLGSSTGGTDNLDGDVASEVRRLVR